MFLVVAVFWYSQGNVATRFMCGQIFYYSFAENLQLILLVKEFRQEGQHPLTGQRAANFRLLANQWDERRLVTQWRHGCGAMRRSVCNVGASTGGRSLCVQISIIKGTELLPANILIPLERQLTALQLCRWYNETLLQTFRPLLSKSTKRRQIYAFWSPFWGS